ncbi:hypothetical protein BJX61DRAFT_539336 [Aspergillus egyptiacus]|nr:hypothetical protein BJX61DRAFT_539336 [Aspergillus egyptiacus]
MNDLKRTPLTTKQFWSSFLPRKDTPQALPDSIALQNIQLSTLENAPLLDSQQSNSNRQWIKGVRLCAWIATGVLFVNIILTAVAAAIAYLANEADGFVSVPVYRGKCSTSKRWTTGLHFLINVLSTTILAASNYCLQCLASPSRAEVDNAHRKRRWLSIGIPNIAGLLLFGKGRRRPLGLILLLTSLPIHLIYNSAIYNTLGPSEYDIAIVQANKTLGDDRSPFRNNDDRVCAQRLFGEGIFNFASTGWEGELKKLSKQECLDEFTQDYVYGHRVLFLETSAALPDDQHLLYLGTGGLASGYTNKNITSFSWMCIEDCSRKMLQDALETWSVPVAPLSDSILDLSIPDAIFGGYDTIADLKDVAWPDLRKLWDILRSGRPTEEELRIDLNNPGLWDNSSWAKGVEILGGYTVICKEDFLNTPQVYRIESCLSLPSVEKCQLKFSPPICLIVIFCNTIKVICIFVSARDDRDDPLLTVGDAISSFLTRPDPATEGAALLSLDHAKKGALGWPEGYAEWCSRKLRALRRHNDPRTQVPCCLGKPRRWMEAASKSLWLGVLLMIASLLVVAGWLLGLGVNDIYENLSSASIWDYDIGEVSTATLITGLGRDQRTNIIALMLLANTPQLLVSFNYFMYNALLTSMLLAAECDGYSKERKPLRVSWPQGAQRSTYYLSLPYRYSIPLLAASAFLHWLVSQSLFFVEIIPYDIQGAPVDHHKMMTCGYSPQAIIYAMILGGVLIAAALILGSRRFKSSIPLMLHCSAAISAACHPCTEGNHALMPVQWGEIVVHSTSTTGQSDQEGDQSETEGSVNRSLQAVKGAALSHLAGVQSSIPRYFHCSFTSMEVVEPHMSRLYT